MIAGPDWAVRFFDSPLTHVRFVQHAIPTRPISQVQPDRQFLLSKIFALLCFASTVLTFFIAAFLYLLRFERVDNLGAYRIPPETGLLIPSDFAQLTSELPVGLRVRNKPRFRNATLDSDDDPQLCLRQTHNDYQTQSGCSLNQTWTMNAKMPPKKSIPITP